jgi:general secretion pathway protein H
MMFARSAHRTRVCAESGFTLLEMVCVIAIIAMLAVVILPILPRGTSRAQLESYAIAIAGLLKADRDAAIRRDIQIVTKVSAASRFVHSGATDRSVVVPNDVAFDALLAGRCEKRATRSAIQFFPSGMSCGGVIALSRSGFGYQIRVNWMTGRVEIVALNGT